MGIGPSTKETTLHHFRDPLLEIVSSDDDIDLVGVIIVGTPQHNEEKHFVGRRTAAWLESMRVDGAIISVDGWGNSHVDYANTIEEIGSRGIPVVGLSFVGTQGKFVIKNQYMDTIVDFNKSKAGIETEVVGENTPDYLDAKKALAFLKLKMKEVR
ncbi:D-proline reductase (dithiol) PrdE [Anaerosolibacter carboniphilus]|uniref:D-proline reductase (Dithiol) PrdE n=1 Tax=Anaerosolibacter carboniphilus TaxID=1417629 RepID=A0A841KXP1_9FIRM|nr:glycine/sarcosine/betaine reductase component B subunit [Anaerosolibacter carboniphilus]MBB6218404.1 D-proline reductase (dithiol) PrdE [Anaerosolibacter carboniphilus]